LPTLLMCDGYDGTMEELFFDGGLAALKRGYAVLMIDGPGQGNVLTEQGLYFRPDWEAVVTPQVDWLLTRPEVDSKRIALIGRSWGGYLAPRAATAEHRLAAVIADAAQYSPGSRVLAFIPEEYGQNPTDAQLEEVNEALLAQMAENPFLKFSFERGMLTHGFDRPVDYVYGYFPYTIEGLAEQITCPTLICEGENDVRGGNAKPLYDAIVAPKDYFLFKNDEGAGEHDEIGASFLFAQRVFDWLDETLAAVK
jgi:pimeloyl-ACP methyl ester carboxylesterase